MTRSLDTLRSDLTAIVRSGIAAVDAARLVANAIAPAPSLAGPVRVVAAGKAAVPMARAACEHLGDRVRGGVVIGVSAAKDARECGGLPLIVGGHPTPSADSERGGRAALRIAESLAADETLLFLLSGGASAIMAVPADGVTLEDKQQTTRQLLRAGADIYALNTVRKHLSAIKGGWLAARASSRCCAFAISDVVGDDLSVIGSGPTVPDASTFRDALEIVGRFGGEHAYPSAVVRRLVDGANGRVPETPKPHDPRLARTATTVIGSRRDAMDGAVREAESLGYRVVRIDDAVVGEARVAGPAHLRAALARAAGTGRPACFVSSGETTVRVTGDGAGGRNQEFSLACADVLAAAGGAAVLASVGSDGIDGPTDAAGAIVDTTTLDRARGARLQPRAFLDRNDSFRFFEALGDLVRTGPTGTNVGDLQIILLA